MSTSPGTPPGTPSKQQAKTVNGTPNPYEQNKQKGTPKKTTQEDMTIMQPPSNQLGPMKVSEPEEVVQIPLTPKVKSQAPATPKPKIQNQSTTFPTSVKKHETVAQNGVTHEEENDADQTEDENESTEADEEEEDSEADLPPFEYEATMAEFLDKLRVAENKEAELMEQFVDYCQLFDAWSRGGANKVNTRATKRLKTRERFVQLSEADLEKKKEHYESVVKAFQVALDLLSK
ncbi:hypothetical protein BGZ60DRAFT_238334 [Tricladium varicosporioides]|nr:hypothetical protein BGZ60DRAFT_238334 [Hymenoscyphus varicosporioides]